VEVVLERGAGEQESVLRRERAEDDGEFRLVVLYAVSLVDDKVVPLNLSQKRLLEQNHLVRRDAQIEAIRS
jgi:hypothetical protein